MAGGAGDRLSPPYDWLPDGALAKLGRRIERRVNVRGWPFDEFAPEAYVEGELGDAELHDFVAEAPPIVREAYELWREVWGCEVAPRSRTIDAHAARLRRKLSSAGAEGLVAARRGVGYSLIAPHAVAA
jgi:DNA-binding response OmpR family regulator